MIYKKPPNFRVGYVDIRDMLYIFLVRFFPELRIPIQVRLTPTDSKNLVVGKNYNINLIYIL